MSLSAMVTGRDFFCLFFLSSGFGPCFLGFGLVFSVLHTQGRSFHCVFLKWFRSYRLRVCGIRSLAPISSVFCFLSSGFGSGTGFCFLGFVMVFSVLGIPKVGLFIVFSAAGTNIWAVYVCLKVR